MAILWPKKDIYTFFKDHSCPKNVLSKIANWEDEKLSRSTMIDNIFSSLSDLPDNGNVHFTLMLDSLSEWMHFDEYWFKTTKKLSLEDAKIKIKSLREARDNEIGKTKKRLSEQREREENRQKRFTSLEEMKKDFHKLATDNTTSQERGNIFQDFLTKMIRFYDLKATSPFRIEGTQIDGGLKYDGENYNIEAKWHNQQLSDEPLMAFCHKQEINMHGRGIFISINGITSGALSMLQRSSIKNTIIMDGEDIALIINEMISLLDTLDIKIHAAQTKGEFYINALTRKSKIKS